MKLLVITNDYDERGDILGFLPKRIQAIAANIDSVVVLTQHEGSHTPKNNIKVIEISKNIHPGVISRLIILYRRLWSLRSQYNRILFIMNPSWIIASFPFSFILRKPMFLWYAVWRGSFKLRIANLLCRKVATSVLEAFPFKSGKSVAIGQGIDTELFYPNPAQRIVGRILFVGRISPVKRLDDLLRAFSRLKDKDTSLIIAGAPISQQDVSYEDSLKKLSVSLDISDRVTWLGSVPYDEIMPLYQSADIFVNLTPIGSFDKAALEALSCGAIVISSNKALLRFLPPEYREICSYSNHKDLTIKLDALLADHERDRMRMELREVVINHHSIQQWTQKIINLLA